MDTKHRFHTGDRVSIKAQVTAARPRGPFRITLLLPPEAGDNMYRVKSDVEQHERVVGESRLVPAT